MTARRKPKPAPVERAAEPLEFKRPALMPASTPDFMTQAWLDCLHWAIGFDPIREAFERDTNFHWKPARNAIDRLIDEATGADRAFIELFVKWFNENVWGDVEECGS